MTTQNAGPPHGSAPGEGTPWQGGAPWQGGTPAHHLPWSRQQRRRVFWPILGMVVAAMAALTVVGTATSGLSGSSVTLGTVLALIPVVVVVAVVLWLDRWEPEPGGMLLAAFLWGAGVATSAAIVVNTAVGEIYDATASAIISAPVVEELIKGAFLIILLFTPKLGRQLNGPIDGIVYAAMVAGGFAFVENILYLSSAFEASAESGWMTFVLRGLMSPFAHPLFTAFIGVAVSLAARRSGVVVRVVLPLLGLVTAIGVHALWNLSATAADGTMFFPVYIVVMAPIFLIMIGVVLWQRRRERRIVATYVPHFVDAGWVAPSEVDLLASMARRRRWRSDVTQQSGAAPGAAVKDYQTAVTELAFLADRLARGVAGQAAHRWHAELVGSVQETRAAAIASARHGSSGEGAIVNG